MSNGVTTRFRHMGKRVTFRTLCERFGLPYYVLWRRYARGERGERLVRPVETKYGHRGRWSEADAPIPTNPHPQTRPASPGLTLTT
jgi:hypothetical protein